jgi:hypothetical protein
MRYAIGLHVTLNNYKKVAGTTFLLVILAFSLVSVSFGLQSSSAISSTGVISYWPRVDITVNLSKVIGINNLSLGFMVNFDWKTWRDRPIMRQLAGDADFRIVRVFSIRIEPCTSWDDSTKTGTFTWGEVDSLVQRIFEVGAEPLICLGFAATDGNGLAKLPNGMTTNLSTGLPYPDSWAAYCKEWVKHFKQTGKPVRFYEIINEPWMYFGWNNYTRLGNFKTLFNAAAQAMRAENPNVLLGFDGTNRKPVLNYWLNPSFGGTHQVGADLDFISFHKYDSDSIGRYNDQQMFNRAETAQLLSDPGGPEDGYYGVEDSRQIYYNARGKLIPVINSESNFNSAWVTGTDPKIQQMAGAVWTALVLRTGVLKGLNYNVYFTFSSSKSWELANKPSGGWGSGMVNSDDNQPWYPYYVQWMIGNGLSVDNSIVESVSSSDEVRVLSWTREGKLNTLLICKVDQPRIVYLYGISSQLNITRIDNTISWEAPSLQTSVVNPADPLIVNGYTVMWLQS